MNKNKITNVQHEDVYEWDFPDFCDAFIVSADYDGVPMTEEQLEEINEDRDFVYNSLMSNKY